MSLNNKRWIYLAAGTLMLLFLGLIYGWSIFRAPLTGYYPNWSASQLSLTFTISMIMFCLGGFFSGLMLKKVSHRVLLAVAAVIGFVGFFCISTVEGSTASAALIKLYIFYGVLCGFAVGISYNSIIGTVNKWFKDKPGLASGAMLMASGSGNTLCSLMSLAKKEFLRNTAIDHVPREYLLVGNGTVCVECGIKSATFENPDPAIVIEIFGPCIKSHA